MTALLRKPSAWLPMVMPLVAFVLVLAFVAAFGVVKSADEGAPARAFQLFMVVEAVAIGSFALRWLPAAPRPARAIVAVQVLLAAVPIATIAWLER